MIDYYDYFNALSKLDDTVSLEEAKSSTTRKAFMFGNIGDGKSNLENTLIDFVCMMLFAKQEDGTQIHYNNFRSTFYGKLGSTRPVYIINKNGNKATKGAFKYPSDRRYGGYAQGADQRFVGIMLYSEEEGELAELLSSQLKLKYEINRFSTKPYNYIAKIFMEPSDGSTVSTLEEQGCTKPFGDIPISQYLLAANLATLDELGDVVSDLVVGVSAGKKQLSQDAVKERENIGKTWVPGRKRKPLNIEAETELDTTDTLEDDSIGESFLVLFDNMLTEDIEKDNDFSIDAVDGEYTVTCDKSNAAKAAIELFSKYVNEFYSGSDDVDYSVSANTNTNKVSAECTNDEASIAFAIKDLFGCYLDLVGSKTSDEHEEGSEDDGDEEVLEAPNEQKDEEEKEQEIDESFCY